MDQKLGTLTAAQLQIMRLVWNAGRAGICVAEIWAAIAAQRPIARTTVLTFVQRLEQAGWVKRLEDTSPARYVTTRSETAVTEQIAAEFVQEFFDGSAANLMMSLLGSRDLKSDDIERLRQALEEAARDRDKKGRR